MTTNIVSRKGHKMQLNGDILTGDTFAMKDYIKARLSGKWVADQKAWRVDITQVDRWLSTVGAEIRIDDQPRPSTASPKLMSYAEFYRQKDDPNSDY